MRVLVLLTGVAVGAAVAACSSSGGDDVAPAAEAAINGCAPADDAAPDDLACTGLYADLEQKVVAANVKPYAPAVAFWSDGAEKSRFILLPDGQKIDATTVDDWKFPVGTKAWKEMKIAGKRIETRYWEKKGEGRWFSATYVWTADESRATKSDGIDLDVNGQRYHVPNSSECNDCHRGRKDKLLGFEAISLGLSGATGITLADLVAQQRIEPVPAQTAFTIADDGTGKSAAALGWLHANCGTTCHNGTAGSTAYSTKLRLRLSVAELVAATPATWEAVMTSVGVDAFTPSFAGEKRITPGAPDQSLLVRLITSRGTKEQMPPISTNIVDPSGSQSVIDWITALAPAAAPADPPADP